MSSGKKVLKNEQFDLLAKILSKELWCYLDNDGAPDENEVENYSNYDKEVIRISFL